MGRAPATDMPYLALRPETASLSYRRVIPPALRANMSGEVFCRWSGRAHKIGGSSCIKISFNTADRSLAAQRWADIHNQVSCLIDMAEKRAAAKPRPLALKRLQTLTPDMVHALGERQYHDLLAEEDAIGPRRAERVERVSGILDEMGIDGEPSDAALRAAEIEHHERAQSIMRDALATENWEGVAETQYFDVSGQWTSERPPLQRLYYVAESLVDEVLARHSVELPDRHAARVQLARVLCQQTVRAHSDIIRRKRDHAIVLTPPPTPVPLPLPEQPKTGLLDAYEMWKADRRPALRTAGEFRLYAQRFIEVCGDLDVKEITRRHVKTFRDAMLRYPSVRREAAVPGAPGIEGGRTLSVTTVNDRAIGAISAILGFAAQEDLIPGNPCTNVRLKKKVGDGAQRAPYSTADLNVIFRGPIYATGLRPRGGAGEAAFWLPLLALASGARLEELAQLRVADVKAMSFEARTIHYFDLATLSDEETAATPSRKTESSRRYVPVHSKLIEIGFLQYASSRREQGGVYFFPDLREYRGKRSVAWSKWWGRYARQLFAEAEAADPAYKNDKTTVFHSFRHAFSDACRAARLEHVVLQDLIGHSAGGTTSKYGNGYAIHTLSTLLDSVIFDEVTFPCGWEALRR